MFEEEETRKRLKMHVLKALTGVTEIDSGLSDSGSVVCWELPLCALKPFSNEVFPLSRTREVVCSNRETPTPQQLRTRRTFLAFMSQGGTDQAAPLGPSTGATVDSLNGTLRPHSRDPAWRSCRCPRGAGRPPTFKAVAGNGSRFKFYGQK